MTAYTLTVAGICPVAHRDAANRMLAGMQHGPANFSVEAGPDPDGPATHLVLAAPAMLSFAEDLAYIEAGIDGIEGEEQASIAEVLAQVKFAFAPRAGHADTGQELLAGLMGEAGLVQIAPSDAP
ncbi:hypothetical protein [Wenxinia saemankumensis]|uniref:Uncharacterized protein n=1 Tax=Wenxinia saemankumensis TaxID=1447782 RepID=A0A1M6GJX5_9RHOB|nr:hypothetical protein [Wenxinia saemankumensis]SHJ10226.1 hypothetical protein SAMN05444417_2779 [Wenxinia saemankumensis]